MSQFLLATADGLVPLKDDGEEGPRIAVLPAADVVLHRIRLAGTSVRERRAEAEALAETLSATPASDLHVALGPNEEDGSCWMALADRTSLAEQLKRLEAETPSPDLVVPAVLLVPPGGAGMERPASANLGDLTLVRSADWAGAMEPALAAHLGATGPHLPFVPGAVTGLFDLRQGRLAVSRPFWTERWFQWGAGLMLLLGLLLASVPPVAGKLRERFETEALDAATVEMASRALGRSQPDAVAAERAVRVGASPPPVAPRLAALLAALEPRADASLAALALEGDQIAIGLDGSAQAINAVARTLSSGPYPARQDGDMIRMGAAASAEARDARSRFEAVRVAAPLAARRRAASAAKPAVALQAHLASAGLTDARAEPAGAGARVLLPAVRAQLLLPLLGRIESDGLRVTGLSVKRNADPSLAVVLEVG
jgi:hypothetical protein